jgi:FkbH-like protein
MSQSVTDALRSVLATASAELAEPVRVPLQLTLARQYIAAGDLAEAGETLSAAGAPSDARVRGDVAALWLALARAHGQCEAAENALRHASTLDPAHGWPALAQYLQRAKRWSEAVEAWQAAIRADPHEPNAYLSQARAFERLAQPEKALAAYLALIDAAPSARGYLTVATRLEDLDATLPAISERCQVRIALIGNATLDHLASYVRVECFKVGLRPSLYLAPFDQVTQEILNPSSGLYAFAPDVVICAMHASRLFPRVHHNPFDLTVDERRAEVDAGLSAMQALLDVLTERSTALVLVHSMVRPQHPALGTLDWRDELGQNELFADINRRLAEVARVRYRGVYLVDEDCVQSRIGKAGATDPRLWLTARLAWNDNMHRALAHEYLRYIKPYRGLSRKCIVLDLDNTLWGGVVGEDGIEGIQLGADAPGNAFVAFQRELERLWHRGILLALCSKNNLDDALPVFERHPAMVLKREHIAAHRINWQPKATNLRELAAELNIGLDSLVFLDDNPVERAAVRSELPEVLVPELPSDPALYRAALLELDAFESLAVTSEDRQRGKLYAEQAQRREFENAIRGASIEDYLAGLNMTVEIEPVNATSLARIAQLTNKTNQFNLTTRRYSEADILAMRDSGVDVLGMRVTDRFGDNGLVGVAILMPNVDGAREVDTLLLSCRVMGRGVETALLAYLADQARQGGASVLRGRFIPTAKNAPSADVYARHGFALMHECSQGTQVWELDVNEGRLTVPAWLTLHTAGLAQTLAYTL